MTDPTGENLIHNRLYRAFVGIEAKYGVRILYACEAGSRAWGFDSPDSDYDVRFIYCRRTEEYLTVKKKREDVIEIPIVDDLDINGWDLSKALALFHKSNPPLLEWLQSPYVYRDDGFLAQGLRALLETYFSPVACAYHYFHMARNNNRQYLQGNQVLLKKYFYVLRPVMACHWISQGRGPVPTRFEDLLSVIAHLGRGLRHEIDGLLAAKKSTGETGTGPRCPLISLYLEKSLALLEHRFSFSKRKKPGVQALDCLFRETLIHTNGPVIYSNFWELHSPKCQTRFGQHPAELNPTCSACESEVLCARKTLKEQGDDPR